MRSRTLPLRFPRPLIASLATLALAGEWGSPASAQPVAKASFLADGSFTLPEAGEGALERPWVLAWAPSGEIHVADERAGVGVFDASGAFVRSYGAGQFRRAQALDMDARGAAYLLDSDQKTVLVFDAAGELVHRLGRQGGRVGQLDDPVDVAVGPTGFVYVLDKGRRVVAVFGRDGTFVHDVVLPADLGDPRSMAVGSTGHVYVADRNVPGAVVELQPLTSALGLVDRPAPEGRVAPTSASRTP